MLFTGGDWNVCHTRVDWNCFMPHQWGMRVIFRIAWLYIEVMFVVDHQRKRVCSNTICVLTMSGMIFLYTLFQINVMLYSTPDLSISSL